MPQNDQKLTINVSSDLTMTPFTGASLVNEIFKGLLYQKCQIPYPYNWLKQVVDKRRKRLNSHESGSKKINFTHENHFRVVSSAYDYLHSVMKGVTKEFCESVDRVEEIVVVFGPSANCPREVFTVAMPSVERGHVERNHLGQLNKHLQKVLRNIFLSQTWIDSIDATISCTNTYVYLKKSVEANNDFINEPFEACLPLKISPNIKHLKCRISYNEEQSERTNCCADLAIFNESESEIVQVQVNQEKKDERVVWCRSKGFLKGFKDCFDNKVSVCELW